VFHLDTNQGFPAAVAVALGSPDAAEADYILLLHDDALLSPDAIERMVETAERIEDAGIVGPKVLDWEEPRLLREVGMSSDRFAYPSSPLEEGEIDQGQYDRVREVLFVSSCAMLVSRSTWSRIGAPDERFDSVFEDLDFCWRARVAGFRILMTPAAEARHRGATDRGERPAPARHGERYERERCALAAVLKNYGLLSLLWVLPLYAIQGAVRVVGMVASRRFGDAYQVLAAWGWNVLHLPGTIARRVRAQRVRKVPDREVRRFMAPAVDRIRRWAATARETLLPAGTQHEAEDEDAETAPRVRVRTQVGRLALGHPVAAAWVLGAFLAAIAYRNLLGGAPMQGGMLLAFPSAPSDFFRELGSGLRHTGLGGSQPASPALGILGLASVISFASGAVLQKVLLLGLPALAGVACFRAVRSVTGRLAPSVVAGACYTLSATVLWALSQGRIPTLVLLAGLPWLAMRFHDAFDQGSKTRRLRSILGAGLGLAVLASFDPGTFLVALLAGASAALLSPGGTVRLRGVVLVGGTLAMAAVLALPVTLGLIWGQGRALGDLAGSPSFAEILRLSLGGGPGSSVLAFYLPVAAALSLVFVARRWTRVALWALLMVIASVYLAWLGGAGYLPGALTNPAGFVGLAAFGCSMLVGLGLASLAAGVELQSFGYRQVGGAALLAVLAVGLLAQAGQAGNGGWSVGGADRLPLSYALVAPPQASGYRILWLGRYPGDGLVAPSGPAQSRIAAGPASVSFALTGPEGGTILDAGRAASGPGYEALDRTLSEILGGGTSHGGALLAPFGIRFVVARAASVPPAAMTRLSAQLDLARVPGGDLVVFRNPAAAPLASVISAREWAAASTSTGFSALASLPAPEARSLSSGGQVSGGDGLLLLSQQFDSRWRLEAGASGRTWQPQHAFGWAVGFTVGSDAAMSIVRFHGQTVRDVELALLTLLWAAALWITRRPAGG
jgi:GT2 family glycosyltransferase